VDAGDDRVGRQEKRPFGWLDDGGVVTDGGEALTKTLDERELVGQNPPPVTSTYRA